MPTREQIESVREKLERLASLPLAERDSAMANLDWDGFTEAQKLEIERRVDEGEGQDFWMDGVQPNQSEMDGRDADVPVTPALIEWEYSHVRDRYFDDGSDPMVDYWRDAPATEKLEQVLKGTSVLRLPNDDALHFLRTRADLDQIPGATQKQLLGNDWERILTSQWQQDAQTPINGSKTYQVWHDRAWPEDQLYRTLNGGPLPTFPADYVHVANVKANGLREAVDLTNDIGGILDDPQKWVPWEKNDRAEALVTAPRDTVSGDVIVDPQGFAYRVEGAGFKEIPSWGASPLSAEQQADYSAARARDYGEADATTYPARVEEGAANVRHLEPDPQPYTQRELDAAVAEVEQRVLLAATDRLRDQGYEQFLQGAAERSQYQAKPSDKEHER